MAQECKNRGQLDTLYCDENNDLVADVPTDLKKLKDPATLVFACALPIACLLLSLVPAAGVVGALLAAMSMALGLAVERWLFFAEAEHVSMLYYGADAA